MAEYAATRLAPFVWSRPEGAPLRNGLNLYPKEDPHNFGWILKIGPLRYRNRLSGLTGIRYRRWEWFNG